MEPDQRSVDELTDDELIALGRAAFEAAQEAAAKECEGVDEDDPDHYPNEVSEKKIVSAIKTGCAREEVEAVAIGWPEFGRLSTCKPDVFAERHELVYIRHRLTKRKNLGKFWFQVEFDDCNGKFERASAAVGPSRPKSTQAIERPLSDLKKILADPNGMSDLARQDSEPSEDGPDASD